MKKRWLGLMLVSVLFLSACFATDLAGNLLKDKAGELSDQLSDQGLADLQQTLEDATGASLEELQLTQQAFGELSAEEIQATVNSAIGTNEEEIRKEYVLPPDVMYITKLGDLVNFQVNQPMSEVIDFYQQAMPKEGYTEREINTEITDMTANLVYSGHASGKLMVVQMVALTEAMTNVSVRLEAE